MKILPAAIETQLEQLALTASVLRELHAEYERARTVYREAVTGPLTPDADAETYKAQCLRHNAAWTAHEAVWERYDACRTEHGKRMVQLREEFEKLIEPHKVKL